MKSRFLALIATFSLVSAVSFVSALSVGQTLAAPAKAGSARTAASKDLSGKTSRMEQGYILDLTSNRPEKFKVQVTKSGIRVDLANAKCTMVSLAPDWNVVAWNSGDRTIMNISHADWCHKYHMNKMHWAAELTKPVTTEQDWFKGVPALRCIFPATEVVGLYMQSTIGKKMNKDNTDDANKAIVMCLDCPSGKSSGSVFARFFGMPEVPGVPISVKRVRENGKSEVTLKPGDIHGVPISGAVFTVPSGYKKVPFSENFFISKAQSENAKALFNSFLN
ncbi:hypothetical protein BH11CYA1_BH11CYA1_15590 [soil metagenome]